VIHIRAALSAGIQLLLFHIAGYASSLAVEKPAEAKVRVFALGAERQLIFGDELVTFLLHAIFHELVLVFARILISDTFA